LVILDHCSTDKSHGIELGLSVEFAERIEVLLDGDPVWHEMAHRQRLLDCARERGATHIVTIDADEVLSGNLLLHARDIVGDTPPGMVLQLPWITCRDSIYQHHRSGLWAEQHASTAFVDDPRLHWQQRNGYDHHQRAPMGRPEVPFKPISHRHGGILHLQYSSRRRLLAKQCWYKLVEAIRWPDKSFAEINQTYNWSVYGQAQKPDDPVSFDLQVNPESWWEGYEDLMQHLHLDAEPWQEAECRKLIEQHGRAKFAGMDLFGVV
jgi:hypothetical protein